MTEKPQNLQDTFLNAVRKSKTSVTIYLVNGVKLQGNITWFDNFCVLLRRDGQVQLVYKHAISTVMPMGPTGHPSRETRRAIVLHVAKKSGSDPGRTEKSRLEEAVALTAAIGLEV